MEESRDLIVGYKIFRSLVYVSLLVEFFLYAVDPGVLDFWEASSRTSTAG